MSAVSLIIPFPVLELTALLRAKEEVVHGLQAASAESERVLRTQLAQVDMSY